VDILDESIPGIPGAFRAVINAWTEGSTPTIKDFLTSLSLPADGGRVAGDDRRPVARVPGCRRRRRPGDETRLLPNSYQKFFDQLVPVLQDRA
jgi:hypothetical protein